MSIISNSDLRLNLTTDISKTTPYNSTKKIKIDNINFFNSIPRTSLVYNKRELRLYLYKTMLNEHVCIQLPGQETIRTEKKNPNDFKPILIRKDGTINPDMDFKIIWDKIDRLASSNRKNSDILGVLFLRIAYMIGYSLTTDSYKAEFIDIASNNIEKETTLDFTWNRLKYDKDIIETLNDTFGLIDDISLEALLYYNDLLAQNEDCKYHYLKGESWDIKNGRINNCLSHLSIIAHCRGYIGISKLLDMFQRTGVGPLPQRDFSFACENLIRTV